MANDFQEREVNFFHRTMLTNIGNKENGQKAQSH